MISSSADSHDQSVNGQLDIINRDAFKTGIREGGFSKFSTIRQFGDYIKNGTMSQGASDNRTAHRNLEQCAPLDPGAIGRTGMAGASFSPRVDDLLRSTVAASNDRSVLDLLGGYDLQGIGLHTFCLNFGINLRLELFTGLLGKRRRGH